MMFLLARDISLYSRHLRRADADCGIAVLPRKQRYIRLHKSRRIGLQIAYKIDQAKLCRNGQERVDVVVCTSNRQNVESAISSDPAKVGPERLRVADQLGAAFGGEDAMNVIQHVGS